MLSARKRKTISIASGLLSALLIVLFSFKLTGQVEALANKSVQRFGSETAQILTANQDIKPGELLSKENTSLKLWPTVLLRDDSIDEKRLPSALNRRASSLILSGEAINLSRLNEDEHKLDRLSPGQSAVTVETNSIRALGSEIEVGMRVTVLGTENGEPAHLLASDVEVISTSAEREGDKTKSVLSSGSSSDIGWVTLAVPDALVTELVRAASSNATYLVMPDDPLAFSKVTLPLERGEDSHD